MRACVRACVRACMRVCVCVCERIGLCVDCGECVENVYECVTCGKCVWCLCMWCVCGESEGRLWSVWCSVCVVCGESITV